jgi:hypothetical protein
MKKSELIALLAQYPDDIDVYVDGYEGDYDAPVLAVERVGSHGATALQSRDGYMGEYPRDNNGVPSLIIGRKSARIG